MNKLICAAVATVLAVSAFAKESKKDAFKLIGAADLAAELKSENPPAVFDANNADTRGKYGVVPGAVLLSDYKKYDLAKVLPSDKKKALVFYCANEQCMASHKAAERAAKAGYADVSVMRDGIMGWAKDGRPVDKPAKN
jgi:rhodanese-related sulfurtransferase